MKALIVREGGVAAMVGCVSHGSVSAAANAAGALWNLAIDAEGGSSKFVARCGAIPPLVKMLVAPDSLESGVENAAGALAALTLDPSLRNDVLKVVGAVRGLFGVLESNAGDEAKANAIAVVWNLCLSERGLTIVSRNSSTIPLLVRGLSLNLDRARENAAGCIATLATQSENAQIVQKEGGIARLVEVLIEGRSVGSRPPQEAAVLALLSCLKTQVQCEIAFRAGVVQPLTLLLEEHKENPLPREAHEAAVALLGNICLSGEYAAIETTYSFVLLFDLQSRWIQNQVGKSVR